jgi:hypothetical protein
MKTSFVPFTALSLLLVSGCGMFAEPDSVLPVDGNPTDAPPRPDGEPAPLEGTPKVSELDESYGFFVRSDAPVDGDGTRARPFATIGKAIEAAKSIKKRVYVCEGTYREAITIADGISMVGGLDCSTATWALGNAKSRVESPTSPALTAASIKTTTRFERFEVIAPDANGKSASSIAFVAKDAAALTIATSRIFAGNGGSGVDGIEAQPKVDGPDADGSIGASSVRWIMPSGGLSIPVALDGGAGGKSACGGSAGGTGGSGGMWKAYYDAVARVVVWSQYRYAAQYGSGGSGAAVDGSNGSSASRAGSFTREGFAPANGTRGTNGSPGRSGAGGDGHAAISQSADTDEIWYGIQGSGGGAGGCGGDAGTEGTGGGASIAALVIDGAISVVDSELVAKNGGAGGKGTFGSASTPGGKGAPGRIAAPASAGHDGTAGGSSGISGSGAGGSSVAIVYFGAKPAIDKTTLSVGQPGEGVAEMKKDGKTIPASASGAASAIIEGQ